MSLLTDEAREFLKKPLIARLSTIGPDGYPHTVPVWFMLDGDDLVIISDRSTRKVGHIEANPKGAISIGGDSGDGGGYLIKGDLSIEEDPDDLWLKKITRHYEDEEQAEKDIAAWADLDIILIRLKPRKVSKVA
ncbi:MAG: hypothetical protein Kow00124_17810 [Anaerolineae bacterium]